MPLVRISLLKGRSPQQLRAIAQGVHDALVEAFGIPPDDRFQIIEQLDPGALVYDANYLGLRRTDEAVFVHIFASTGRDTAQKKKLYAGVADNLARAGIRREDVLVVLTPNTREDWSFGDGLASYVKD